MKKIFGVLVLAIILGISFILYQKSLTQASYNGLTTVPCFDQTKPVLQSFSFHLSIMINNNLYPIDKNLGHDYGKCLHAIYANDTSGNILVKANDVNTYTLGEVFDVWHKTFSPYQIMQYEIGNNHSMKVFVNQQQVEDYRNIILKPNEDIKVIYQ